MNFLKEDQEEEENLFDRLPENCINEIFEWLLVTELIGKLEVVSKDQIKWAISLSTTCKRLRQIATNSLTSIWFNVDIASLIHGSTPGRAISTFLKLSESPFLKLFGKLRLVEVAIPTAFVLVILRKISKPSIRELRLAFGSESTASSEILECIPKELLVMNQNRDDFKGGEITNRAIAKEIDEFSSNLKCLYIDCDSECLSYFNGVEIPSSIKEFTIKIKGTAGKSIETFFGERIGKFPNVKRLELTKSKGAESFDIISRACPSITTFILEKPTCFNEEIISIFKHFNLEKLLITCDELITASSLNASETIPCAKSLKYLALACKNNRISDEIFQIICKSCPELILFFFGVIFITPAKLKMLSDLKHLKILALNILITDSSKAVSQALKSFGNCDGCDSLETLSISNLGECDFTEFFKSPRLQRIKTIHFTYAQIPQEQFLALASNVKDSLEQITVSNNLDITPLLISCPKVKTLSLFYPTPEIVERIGQVSRNQIQSLTIYSENVVNCNALIPALTNTCRICINYSKPEIVNSNIWKFALKCPNLSMLQILEPPLSQRPDLPKHVSVIWKH